jgi:hypothetical protein
MVPPPWKTGRHARPARREGRIHRGDRAAARPSAGPGTGKTAADSSDSTSRSVSSPARSRRRSRAPLHSAAQQVAQPGQGTAATNSALGPPPSTTSRNSSGATQGWRPAIRHAGRGRRRARRGLDLDHASASMPSERLLEVILEHREPQSPACRRSSNDHGGRDARRLRDLAQGHGLEAVPGEQLPGGRDQPGAHLAAVPAGGRDGRPTAGR